MVFRKRPFIEQRSPGAGLLHHSDQGSQVGTQRSRVKKLLAANKMIVSMSGKGNCWDNAPTENFLSTIKRKQLHHKYYETCDSSRIDIFFYIEAFYNRKLCHSALGYLNPVAFEEIYCNNQSVSSLYLQYWWKISQLALGWWTLTVYKWGRTHRMLRTPITKPRDKKVCAAHTCDGNWDSKLNYSGG